MLEAIKLFEEISGRQVNYSFSPQARAGDHIWWISDVSKFQRHYPAWSYSHDLKMIMTDIVEAMAERTKASVKASQ